MEWISVKDRLPEGEVLLLTTSKMIIIGDLYENKWRSTGRWKHDGKEWVSDFEYSDITHWMPLPSVPSKVEKLHLSNVSGSLHTEFLVGKNFCPICSPGIYANSRVQHHAPREKCIECGHVQEYHIVNPTQ